MLSCSNDLGADFSVVSEQGHEHILKVDGVTPLLHPCLVCGGDPVPTSPKPAAHDESCTSIQCIWGKLP